MGFWEVAGLIVGGFITAVSALKSGRDSIRWLWRSFGWHGNFWAWLVRAVRAVDVVLSIPERMARNEQLLAEHLAVAGPQVELLDQMARDLGVVVHEVKHNGGSSMKDAVARIEAEQAAVAAQLKITRPKRGSQS